MDRELFTQPRFIALYKHPLTLWLLFVVLHAMCLVTQLCPTLCNPMDCSLPCSSVHGILQARILEWVAMRSPSGNLPNPGIEPRSPALQTDSLPSQPQFLTCQGKTLKTFFKIQHCIFVNTQWFFPLFNLLLKYSYKAELVDMWMYLEKDSSRESMEAPCSILTYCALCISSIWMFICILSISFYNKLVKINHICYCYDWRK